MGWLSRVFGGDARAPRDVDAALRAALLAVLDRDYDEAEKMLLAAVRLDSEAVEPYLALARLLRTRGEIGRAIRIHQNLLLRLDPSSKYGCEALAGLAADFRQGGLLRRAIASYEELVSRDPKRVEALRMLLRLHAEVRDFARAIQVAKRLARIEGGDGARAEAELRVQMAETALAEGRSDDARRAVKQALRKDKQNVRAWIVLGDLEAERDRAKAALAAWARVPAIDRRSGPKVYPQLEATYPALDRRSGPQVYPQLEATYAALGRPREFEVLLRELLDERPDDSGARLALARTLAARGDADDAVAELRRILGSEPDDVEARSTLGRLLLSEHREADATKEYGELLHVLERRGLGAGPGALE
jgi:lipopolysaccharide biosynthesis regulator YciM